MEPVLYLSSWRLPRVLIAFLFVLLGAGWVPARSDVDPFSEANRYVADTNDRIKFDVAVDKKEVKPGDVIRVTITGTLTPGYHTYPLTKRTEQQDPNYLAKLTYLDTSLFKPLYPIHENEPTIVDEGASGILAEHESKVVWEQDFLVLDKDEKTGEVFKTGKKFIHMTVWLQVCAQNCVFGLHLLDTKGGIIFEAQPMPALSPDLVKRLQKSPPPPEILPITGFAPSVRQGDKAVQPKSVPSGTNTNSQPLTKPPGESNEIAAPGTGQGTDLLTFIGLAIFWGALSLITPCVFPMIPITVSYFIHQSEQKKNSPLLLAAIYSGTIAGVLTLGGIFLLQILLPFSQHYLTNLFLGGLFLVFAFSLFGMYEIVLPSRLVNLTSAQEGRGGLIGTVFMALTFSLISFTCVAPFYGGFIALVSSSSESAAWWSNPDAMLKLCLGALAYSVTFASPFFFLALFPSLMRALPKSGSWMNTVKVVMGFLELAAAFKLLRGAELGLLGKAEFLTYDFVLGIYVALSLACGLYLLNLFRLPHDHATPATLSVPRLLLSIAFISVGLYLLPGLFKQGDGDRQRPNGVVFSWMESFLLPDETPGATYGGSGSGSGTPAAGNKLVYHGNLEKALQQAKADNKLVFIDFTGKLCTNCVYNENTVFTQPMIRALLGQYTLVKLYCDFVPAEFEPTTSASDNLAFERENFQTVQRPLYVIVRPTADGKFEKLGVYPEAKINSPNAFADFLKKPLPSNVVGR
jgi:thiol:disulfide interchange protein